MHYLTTWTKHIHSSSNHQKEKKSKDGNKKMETYMHQWILQGNGEIALELGRGWVSLSLKEINSVFKK